MLGYIATVLLTIWHSNKEGIASTDFYNSLSINVLLMATGLFLFVKNKVEKIKNEKKNLDRILKCSQYSFGAYLVHALVLEKMNTWLGINTLTCTPFIALPVIVVEVTIISFAISAILSRIPILKKNVV